MTYHHGDLRSAILQATAEAIEKDGVHAVNLRSLAKDVGVSHTAPRHHFGDKRGVLTALATQGYEELSQTLHAVAAQGSFLDVGVAYVEYALSHPAHYKVLFQSGLVDLEDPQLLQAQRELYRALGGADGSTTAETGGVNGPFRHSDAAVAAWSIVHGFVTLVLSGAIAPAEGETTSELARRSLDKLAV